MAAPTARYGLPEASTAFSSTFAPRSRVLREGPGSGAAAPRHYRDPSSRRRPSSGSAPGAGTTRGCRRRRRAARAARPGGPPGTRRASAPCRSHRRRCRRGCRRRATATGAGARRCRGLSGDGLAENDTRSPISRATVRITSRTSTTQICRRQRPGPGPTDTSSWPGEYSGCTWSTSTPTACSRRTIASRNGPAARVSLQAVRRLRVQRRVVAVPGGELRLERRLERGSPRAVAASSSRRVKVRERVGHGAPSV